MSPDEKINQNCTVVTIGIGNDTNAEESLRIIAPHCQFYGADPIVSAGSLYDRIGRYFPFAVANRNNISEANVIVNSMNESYAKASVLHRDFVDFITKDVGRQVVDVLFLDGEGAEYVILPYLMKDGKAGRHGILVCQISVELHGPVEKYGLNISRWTQIVTDFLLQSDFVPLWTPQPQYHQRMILINSGANLCRRQIFGSKCY